MQRTLTLIACLAMLSTPGCDMPGGEEDGVIRIGIIAPIGTSIPPLAGAAQSFVRVAQTAVEEVNARGGVHGRELILMVRDPDFDPPNGTFGQHVTEVIAELDGLGVVGAIGPVTTATASSAWEKARDLQFPLISMSSTGVSLAEVPDGGFFFRNATNDRVQGLIMTHFLTQLHGEPAIGLSDEPVTCVYVLHENSSYAGDFKDAFVETYAKQGGNTVQATHLFEAPTEDAINAIMAAEACPGARPDAQRTVILITLDYADAIISTWDKMDPRPDIRWILSDGARTPGFVDSAPFSIDGVVGTAPTNPVLGSAFEELEEAYADRFPDENISELAYTPQVWDGVFLLAAGLALQIERAPGEPLGGLGLARAIRDISRGPGVILHAGQWRDLLAAVAAGTDVDFDGAAGPSDFDECGETFGAYEIFRVYRETGTEAMTSRQIRFISPATVAELRATVEGIENDCPAF